MEGLTSGHSHLKTSSHLFEQWGCGTGWPLDPSVITPAMMAASKETSCEAHLPIAPTTPVRVIAKLLQKLAVTEDIEEQVVDGSSNESTDSADAGDGEVDGRPIGHDPKTALVQLCLALQQPSTRQSSSYRKAHSPVLYLHRQ